MPNYNPNHLSWSPGISPIKVCIWLVWLGMASVLTAQEDGVDIQVYDFGDGLSHRNVFKTVQDDRGFIWVATINGLNRFDGHEFITFDKRSEDQPIPHDAISDMLLGDDGRLWLAHPDFLYVLDADRQNDQNIKIKEGNIVRRESVIAHNLIMDSKGTLWMAVFDERSAQTRIQTYGRDSVLRTILTVGGQYPKRPIVEWDGRMLVAAQENELLAIDDSGQTLEHFVLPSHGEEHAHIVQVLVKEGILWVLLDDGHVYSRKLGDEAFQAHPINELVGTLAPQAASLLVDQQGNIWVGGRGVLWYYNALTKRLIDYDERVKQIVKNTCTYRHIFQDQTGTIWASTDFGIIKIVQSDYLFTHYLSGGSEYCSNVFCSIRGMTEDPLGSIYISYYNSIHVLDPQTNAIRLLFPSNDYFNYPFGLQYHAGALWTGNGLRIDLNNLKVDTLFKKPQQDLGAVLVDRQGMVWMGYQYWLYQYDPASQTLFTYEDSQGQWDSLAGQISYLYESPSTGDIWVATLETGLYQLEHGSERAMHYDTSSRSPIRLSSNQINSIYEDSRGDMWLGTAFGLHRLNPQTRDLQVFGLEDGLPNNFINGLLSEGDSVLWVSTDNGLCRFSLADYSCNNFTVQDGLTSNEFNRMSFYQARDGRMYFGGLDGVNAFYPSLRFLEKSQEREQAPLIFSGFTRLDGASDQLISQNTGLDPNRTIHLSYNDRTFSFTFALADYEQPLANQYSYYLDGYETSWSNPTGISTARYNNIPAGEYIFRVRAKVPQGGWQDHQLAIPIVIERAYYRTWWFWALCGSILLALLFALDRYRSYTLHQREKELEILVRERTQELEAEKQKSEDLLLNILPAGTAEELKTFGHAKAKRHEMVTVMFSDFKGFSRISEQLEPEELVAEIDFCFRAFDRIVEKYKLEKIKTVGDAYLCVGGIAADDECVPQAVNIIKAALEIQDFLGRRAEQRRSEGLYHFEARIGVHTGPVVAGIVGIKKFSYDIWGDTVNIASRMESNGAVGEVNISETTYQLTKDHFQCVYHKEFQENSTGMGMYWVEE